MWLTRKLNNKMTLGADAVGGAWWLVLEVVLDDATDLSQYDHVPRNFNLDQDTTVIGRSPGLADVVLDSYLVPTSVSRQHFTITRNSLASTSSSSSEAPFLLQQKPSRNAIKLNNEMVTGADPLPLRHGDEIRLCEYTLRLETEDADLPKATLLDSSKLVPAKRTASDTTDISGERSKKASPVEKASTKRGRASPKDQAKQDMDAIKAFVWTKGLQVEVLALEEGLRGAWFPAVVHAVHDTHVVVEYPEFDEEENEDVYPIVKNNGKDVVRCRPAPPASARTDWALNDHVECPYEGAYWGGTVAHVCKGGSLMVQFPDPPVGEGGPLLEFKPAQLRPEMSWAGDLGWRTKDTNQLVPLDEAPTTPFKQKQAKEDVDKDGNKRVKTAATAS